MSPAEATQVIRQWNKKREQVELLVLAGRVDEARALVAEMATMHASFDEARSIRYDETNGSPEIIDSSLVGSTNPDFMSETGRHVPRKPSLSDYEGD